MTKKKIYRSFQFIKDKHMMKKMMFLIVAVLSIGGISQAMETETIKLKEEKEALSNVRNECVIRILTKYDMPQLIRIIKQSRAEFGFGENHPLADIFEKELNEIYELYSRDKNKYFVIECDSEIIGGGGYNLLSSNEDTCELRNMYISSKFRSLGLGGFLLQRILQEAKLEGFKKCYLETMDFMHGANALYKKCGFQQLDQPVGKTGHDWTNRWYMKEL